MKKSLPKKELRWQKEQKERKNKKRLSPLWTWLGIFSLLIFLGLVFKAYKVIKESRWDGKGRLNLVLVSSPVLIVSLEPEEPSLSGFSIPNETQLEVVYGYGKYQMESVYRLGELEKKENLLAESIQENFALPIDGWLVSENIRISAEEDIRNKLSEILISCLKDGRKTNLTKWDLIRIFVQIKKVRSHKINFFDLSKISVLLKTTLPDRTEVFEIDQNRLDPLVQKYFFDPIIRKEKMLFEVLNGTDHPKLGERAGRIISGLGGEVVSIGNSQEKVEECQIQTIREKKTFHSVKKIANIFNCQLLEKEEEGKAEVTLIVGENYWKKLFQK